MSSPSFMRGDPFHSDCRTWPQQFRNPSNGQRKQGALQRGRFSADEKKGTTGAAP
jgi:hypothetical protein